MLSLFWEERMPLKVDNSFIGPGILKDDTTLQVIRRREEKGARW